MRICCVVGARPNFMKMAPVVRALTERGVKPLLVHTGQHYDPNMSDVFFAELGMPAPDVHLGVGSGSHAKQTAAVLVGFEAVCLEQPQPFERLIVAGDVNSTLAATLVAAKLGIPVAHVEAGLRSNDRTMPEEINRVATDHLSTYLFASELSGVENLRREGIGDPARVYLVGNCMVDSLLQHVETARRAAPWTTFGLYPGGYALVTLHRPSNVDDPKPLATLMEVIRKIARRLPVVFPVHPRTRSKLDLGDSPGLILTEPLPYQTFLGLMASAKLVLTDSGGIQEETTALGVPCLTLRSNTERPATIELGTNRLVGNDPEKIEAGVEDVLAGRWSSGRRPPLWDGRAADRIATILIEGRIDDETDPEPEPS